MSDLRRIVSVLPDGRWNHNVLRNAIVLLGEAIEARGLKHVTIDGSGPDFQRNLLHHLADRGSAIYLGHRYFDLGLVHADAQGDVRRNLFEVLDRPVFAMIQDHPFSNFMWSRMEAASRTTQFLAPTPEFHEEARFINPALVNFHTVSPTLTEPAVPEREMKALAERPLDIFMSCAFYTTNPSLQDLRHRFAAAQNPMTQVIDEVYETGRAERDRSIMGLFLDAYARHMGKPLVLASPMSQHDRAVIDVLSCIDNRIRFDRRIAVLQGLARLDPALRVVITLSPSERERIPALKDRPNIELIGRISAARARELFLKSKFAVNVMPTYTSFLTERVSNAMAFGCCVISDRNRYLAATFAEGEEILFMDGCDPRGLSRYFRDDLDQAQAIASRARRKAVDEFAVAKLADELIAVMQTVV